MILLDTNVLSMMFRRNDTPEHVRPLRDRLQWLAGLQRIAVPGLVIQELLTGIRHPEQFQRICKGIQGIPVLPVTIEQHIAAAQLANRCLTNGVSAHVTDTLLASLALSMKGCVLTEDQDFLNMAPHCGVHVLSVDAAIRMTAG